MYPISFQEQEAMQYFNLKPSSVQGTANIDTVTNKRYLYAKLFSVYDFKLPEEWALNYFRFLLFRFGAVGVIYTKKFGWMYAPFGVEKIDLYKQPSVITVSHELLPEIKTGVIGVNAGIIRIMDDYMGLDDLVTKYAQKLAQVEKSINVNLMNTNVAMVYAAKNKKDADAFKEAYSKATQGEPLVSLNKDIFADGLRDSLIPDVSQNFIADKLLQARRTICNEFLTEIGIRNANYDKKERLNSMEVSENNDETRAIASVILENLTKCFDDINTISSLDLGVSLNYNYKIIGEGGNANA